MKIASGGSHGLSFIKETTPGILPASPVMQALRHTQCSLNLKRDTLNSQELRSDRQISSVRTGTSQISGSIGFELSYAALDDLFCGVLAGSWQNNVLKAGSEQISYSFERSFSDIGQYTVYSGCYLNKFNLSLKPNALISGGFDVYGLTAKTQTVTCADSLTPPPTHLVYDTFSGVIKEGNTSIALITSLDLSLDNGLQPQFVLMQKEAPFITFGRSNLSGTLSAYFMDLTLIDKFLDETPTSLEFSLGNGQHSYTFVIPNIRYTGADDQVSNEGPIQINLPFQAIFDPTLNTNLQITRNPEILP